MKYGDFFRVLYTRFGIYFCEPNGFYSSFAVSELEAVSDQSVVISFWPAELGKK